MAKRKTSMSGFPDRSFTLHTPSVDALDLHGKSVTVVGGTDGLGRAIARIAAARGAEVSVVGRTFRDEGTPRITFVKADLSSMREAERLGRSLPAESLDALVFTTGIMTAKQRETTSEGLERDMAISFLSRRVLLRELAPRLGTARPAGASKPRVFVMGFPGAGNLGDAADPTGARKYDAFAVHMNTVAGNEMLVLEGARKYPQLAIFGLNPGMVRTNIRANYLGEGSFGHRAAELLIGLFTQSPEQYAARIVPLLVAPELEGRSGAMFGAKGQPILPTDGLDEAHLRAFLAASDALLAPVLSPAAARPSSSLEA